MVAGILFILFAVTNVAIIAGYYNTNLGFSFNAVTRVYETVPIIEAALLLTAVLPLNLLIAFYTSRGNYTAYKGEVLALTMSTPFIIVFSILPGELDKPLGLHFNVTTLFIIIIGSQLLFSNLLSDRAWVYGGRETNT